MADLPGRLAFGNPRTRDKPFTDEELVSGDLFVFGGLSRFSYRGVPKTYPDTAPTGTGHESGGRINITLRQTGVT